MEREEELPYVAFMICTKCDTKISENYTRGGREGQSESRTEQSVALYNLCLGAITYHELIKIPAISCRLLCLRQYMWQSLLPA
jgi:hypothetical protein